MPRHTWGCESAASQECASGHDGGWGCPSSCSCPCLQLIVQAVNALAEDLTLLPEQRLGEWQGPLSIDRREQSANLGTSPSSRSQDQWPSREASYGPVWRTPPARHAALIVCQLSRSRSDSAAICMSPASPHQMHAYGQALAWQMKADLQDWRESGGSRVEHLQ